MSMKKAILLPMLCLIALCGCEKSTELSEITGNPETETPENGSLTFQLNADKTTCNLLDLTTFSISFNRTVSMWDISNQFDSIVWIVEDKDKNLHSFRIMEQQEKTEQHTACNARYRIHLSYDTYRAKRIYRRTPPYVKWLRNDATHVRMCHTADFLTLSKV